MSFEFGKVIKASLFGESHGKAVGILLDSPPAGYKIDFESIKKELSHRSAEGTFSTSRRETDDFDIISGINDGYTTGTPLCILMKNEDVCRADYDSLKNTPRPSHADYAALMRFGEHTDISGGGPFSGRLTAPLTAAGSIAKQILKEKGITVGGHILKIGKAEDTPFDPVNISADELNVLSNKKLCIIDDSAAERFTAEMNSAKEKGDSIGGAVEIAVCGSPAGIGGIHFGGLESRISSAVFGVPAVKGIEFGLGFGYAGAYGSAANDSMYYDENGNVKCRFNNCGGITGGISNGMPIVFRVALKPAPSVSVCQKTVDLKEKTDTEIKISGRHDSCIVPRALPAIEAATALSLLDSVFEVK